MRIWVSLVLLLAGGCIATAGTINISEVLYDASGSDNGKAFVELYGPGGLSLSGYSLVGVNGVGGSATHTVSLSGYSIPTDGFFVVADRTGAGTTSVANADLLVSNIDLQNGPDSIQLRYGTSVVDALGYGSFGSSHVFAGERSAAAGVSPGSSLARRFADVDRNDNSADFVALSSPTPGRGALSTATVPTPAASALGLLGLGLLLLRAAVRRRRRDL